MKIIALFIHAYMLVLIYELVSEEKQQLKKWMIVFLIGIAKYFIEPLPFARSISPFVLCTILIIYSICTHSQSSNLKNMQYALIAYGTDYVMNLGLSSVGGFVATLMQTRNSDIKYAVLSVGRIGVMFILLKYKAIVEKIKKTQVLNIGVVGTMVLLFAEQIFGISFTTKHWGYTFIAISFTCLAALFTILWLMDHYKMAKIQKMYAEDNKQMSQKLHRSKEILPMIANYASSMDAAQDEEMRKKLEAVCHDYGKELGGAEMNAELFETTGIDLVDLLLKTKITECVEQDIELDVFVGTQIHKDMKRLDIGDGEIARLIGDLLRNAIHAVNGLKNKMILLLIVKDEDEHVLIRIYDSGIPFPPYVLERFGERGNTTWGTGNGLADLMDTLKRVHASIEINTEMAPGDVFTKEICICFDGEDRVKIPHKDI